MEAKKIGNRISTARKKMNLSQAQLAERLFISPQAVGKWERGESVPDAITLSQLAKQLGVDLNYFSEQFATSSTTTVEAPAVQNTTENTPLNWDMSRGNWVDADFSGLKDLHEKFSSSNMKNCKFEGSDLSGLLLSGNTIDGCDFSGSNISNSQIGKSYFMQNRFNNCDLSAAKFLGCHIKHCNFSGANLTGTVFNISSIQQNDITDAQLTRTSFLSSDLTDLVINSTVQDCYFENSHFSRVTFQDATLLNTFFKCRTLKPIRFVNCRADKMTYEFLKNGKADVSGITLITA
ncbi:pentapeptide repeat-containing protein [Chitinophaga sp. Cy-1792]|uniref:helix-turn-helix domain-containing protein n=1 Tax=Chitinophaga sp. Cy-1792 TaxID=2608339 RepID=UPI0019639F67|nr:pentapeptide repeat-containing protein [Chitinophaga sp. Cy-1792]